MQERLGWGHYVGIPDEDWSLFLSAVDQCVQEHPEGQVTIEYLTDNLHLPSEKIKQGVIVLWLEKYLYALCLLYHKPCGELVDSVRYRTRTDALAAVSEGATCPHCGQLYKKDAVVAEDAFDVLDGNVDVTLLFFPKVPR